MYWTKGPHLEASVPAFGPPTGSNIGLPFNGIVAFNAPLTDFDVVDAVLTEKPLERDR
jgi:hypothetical protein